MKATVRSLRAGSLAVVLIACTAIGHAEDARRRKKLIATGWDKPDTRRLLENLAEMEQRPFDGVVLEATGRREDGKPCRLRWAFLNEPWKQAWFQPCVDDLRACKFKRLTDNFIQLNANPGDVDWFDDDGWRNIVEHCRIAAWVAKQSGCKGILFDAEPYAPPHAQFSYAAQPGRGQHTFDEYCAQARRRGRQVMQAVAEAYPGITLFCYFMNSVDAAATGHADPRRVLAGRGYGLYPAFIDGWLDVVPPTATMVDGCESAYRYNSELEYLEAAALIRGACQELVSPENRAKYRAQVQVGFGVYLDAYWNPKDSKWGTWYVDGLGGPRVDRLRANVRTALRLADEYVWVYGEKFRWWPTLNQAVRQQTWPEALPGGERALRFARDPIEYARVEIAELKKTSRAANLARNGDFGSPTATNGEGSRQTWHEGRAPAGWGAWQREESQGTFTWDRAVGAAGNGSARAANVSDGCLIQRHKVQPGQRYAVRAVRRLKGKGSAWIRVRWQTADGRWTAVARDRLFFCHDPPEKWGEIFGVVEVPEGVGQLVILLGVGSQTSADDVVHFDDVELYRLP